MNCLFCSTGKQGFNRNLKTSEIIGQLWHAEHTLRRDLGIIDENERVISNVVMMGHGRAASEFGRGDSVASPDA